MATSEITNSSFDSNWQSTNPEVKTEYGENYYQTFKVGFNLLFYQPFALKSLY
jgi:hypothetical protein